MTAGCSTRSTSSWRAGSGTVQATVFLTSVMMLSEKCLLKACPVCDVEFKYLCVCVLVDIPMSVGIVEPKTHPSQLNAAEFLWDMNKRTSVFVQVTHTHTHSLTNTNHKHTPTHTQQLPLVPSVGRATRFPHQTHILITLVLLSPRRLQVHCISTEFTPRKHGGEKGVPFRIQFDTFAQGESGEYTEHLHSASCQIKVFKVHTHSFTSRLYPPIQPNMSSFTGATSLLPV